jgi:hypothetical protein
VKNMATDEFPIGKNLIGISTVEYREGGDTELCLDKVQLIFPEETVTLLPIAETDEIEIKQQLTSVSSEINTSIWREFIGKKLMGVWVCENQQGYRDQVIFAFENLRPSIAFVVECSSILAFRYEQISRQIPEANLKREAVVKK